MPQVYHFQRFPTINPEAPSISIQMQHFCNLIAFLTQRFFKQIENPGFNQGKLPDMVALV